MQTVEELKNLILQGQNKLPVTFIPNKGQLEESILFYSRGRGYECGFRSQGVSVTFFEIYTALSSPEVKRVRGGSVEWRFLDRNPRVKMKGRAELGGTVNYFKGNSQITCLPMYSEIMYENVWNGIDVIYKENGRTIKYDLVLHAGSHVEDIRLHCIGVEDIHVDEVGQLRLSSSFAEWIDPKPFAYQEIEGVRIALDCNFKLETVADGGYIIGFDLESYDTDYSVVIDPILLYSTYLGGNDNTQGLAITADSSGSAYVAGLTFASDFPTTPGAFDTVLNGTGDAFVTKFNSTGTALVYSTYLGGSGQDEGRGITVDGLGSAYVTGLTPSADFPTTAGAFQTVLLGTTSAFVTKLNALGTGLIYSTYLGGSGGDEGSAIVVENTTGNVYLTGTTDSIDFPTTPGAFATGLSGIFDVFVTKLNAAGSALIYSTYLGGSLEDFGSGIAIDTLGSAYVTGETRSLNFPTTPGAFSTVFNGGLNDAFVTKLNASGTALAFSTYLGGSSGELGFSIAVDASNFAYVTGLTSSPNFPTTPDSFDPTKNPNGEGFVTKFNLTGAGLVYSTFIGGNGDDQPQGIAVDPFGNAIITGITNSTDFPVTPDAFQGTFPGGISAFISQLSLTGQSLLFSSYLGGGSDDEGFGIAVDPFGVAYAVGNAGPNFPVTPGAFDITSDISDAFVVKLGPIVVPGGPPGPQGPIGPQGLQGLQGIQGNVGPIGPAGVVGPAGLQGPVGPIGPNGLVGAVGPQGEIGPSGPQGPRGPRGRKGEEGDRGPRGFRGRISKKLIHEIIERVIKLLKKKHND